MSHHGYHQHNATPYNKPSMKFRFDSRQLGRGRGRTRGRGGYTRSLRDDAFINNTQMRQGMGRGNRGMGRGNRGMGRGDVEQNNNDSVNYSRRRGYGYVGTIPLNMKKKKQQYEKGGDYNLYRNKTTKSKYYKSQTISVPIAENEIRIVGDGSVQQFVHHSLKLFENKANKMIIISATGRAISKAINCVEVLKRKQHGLHQETSIEERTIKEIWEPLELCLKQVIVEYKLTYLKIKVSFDKNLLNCISIGYQSPISWIDLGDARQLYNKMSDKIDKLRNKLNNKNDIIDGLEDELEEQWDEVQSQKIQSNKDYDALEAKYDAKLDIIEEQRKDYNTLTTNMSNLKEKYETLLLGTENTKKEKEIRDEKYDNLNANELVELIINLNPEKYEKYEDGLLRGFVEEGVDGSCLHELTKEDLYRFGVTQFKDKLSIYNQIKNLFP